MAKKKGWFRWIGGGPASSDYSAYNQETYSEGNCLLRYFLTIVIITGIGFVLWLIKGA